MLFSASLVIFVFVFSFRNVTHSAARPDHPKFDRRRGFSNRATAAIFVATVINFLLLSLFTGSQVAMFVVSIRKTLILDIDHPLSERPELVNNALRNANLASVWALTIPVSIKLSPPNPASIHARWRCCSVISLLFGGLGPSSEIDSGSSSCHSFCGLRPWVCGHFPGSLLFC